MHFHYHCALTRFKMYRVHNSPFVFLMAFFFCLNQFATLEKGKINYFFIPMMGFLSSITSGVT